MYQKVRIRVVEASQISASGQVGESNEKAALVAIAHELKTPLAVITHLAAALRDTHIQLSALEQQQYLERIEFSGDRMLRLVEGLTQSYRLEQQGQLNLALEVEPVNLGQVCEEAAHELTPLARQLHQTLQLQLPKAKLVVAHRLFLHNVVVGLLDNALKHNPAETAVLLRLQGNEEKTQLHVRDNGPGMSHADFRTLEQRLGRELQPTGLRAGSSGLGLYVAGQLTRAMGGELGVLRHRLGGMTFYVELLASRQLSLI